jgi:hypothetical protein
MKIKQYHSKKSKKSSKVKPSPHEVFALRHTRLYTSNTIAKIKQSQGKSERGFRLSPRMKSSNTIAKKNAQIKQSQAKSERGFVIRPGVILDKIDGKITQKKQKSSKTQPSPNEVFALRHARQG